MIDKNTDFPQYRKVSNGKTFYKVLDDRTFLEIQIMGTKHFFYKVEAKQYPEMLKIKDILELVEPYEMATEKEWMEMEKFGKSDK